MNVTGFVANILFLLRAEVGDLGTLLALRLVHFLLRLGALLLTNLLRDTPGRRDDPDYRASYRSRYGKSKRNRRNSQRIAGNSVLKRRTATRTRGTAAARGPITGELRTKPSFHARIGVYDPPEREYGTPIPIVQPAAVDRLRFIGVLISRTSGRHRTQMTHSIQARTTSAIPRLARLRQTKSSLALCNPFTTFTDLAVASANVGPARGRLDRRNALHKGRRRCWRRRRCRRQ